MGLSTYLFTMEDKEPVLVDRDCREGWGGVEIGYWRNKDFFIYLTRALHKRKGLTQEELDYSSVYTLINESDTQWIEDHFLPEIVETWTHHPNLHEDVDWMKESFVELLDILKKHNGTQNIYMFHI